MTPKQKALLATDARLNRFIGRDCGWRAAIHILTSRHFANNPRAWKHVDLEKQSIFFTPMIEEGWSETEDYMLRIASSLFNGDHQVKLYYAFNRFDEDQARTIIKAMMLFSFGGQGTISIAVDSDLRD